MHLYPFTHILAMVRTEKYSSHEPPRTLCNKEPQSHSSVSYVHLWASFTLFLPLYSSSKELYIAPSPHRLSLAPFPSFLLPFISSYAVEQYAAFEDLGYYYLVLEYCERGDLFAELKRRRGIFSEALVVRSILQPFLSALR
jgi:serine/threonine protein kinase